MFTIKYRGDTLQGNLACLTTVFRRTVSDENLPCLGNHELSSDAAATFRWAFYINA